MAQLGLIRAEILYGEDRLPTRAMHRTFGDVPIARTYYEAFKGKERSERSPLIYTAMNSATNAVLYDLSQAHHRSFLTFYYPVIVFNGNLFEAKVSDDKNITLSRSNHIRLRHEFLEFKPDDQAAAWQFGEKFTVDVVRDDYLPQFFKLVEALHQPMAMTPRHNIGDTGVQLPWQQNRRQWCSENPDRGRW